MSEANKYHTSNVAQLIHDIKVGKTIGSYEISNKMLDLILKVVSESSWKTAENLMTIVREQGKILVNALPQEAVIANIVRRMLRIIREEYDELNTTQTNVHQSKQIDECQAQSLQKLITQNSERSGNTESYSNSHAELKEHLVNHLDEIQNELQLSNENLSLQAPEHIHSSEIILTLGYSKSVESFLKAVPKKRKFEVVVAECAPNCRGHILAASLAKEGIETTLIPDSTIFAMMSRVNKVIIGTHSVLANGGLRAASGGFTVALAAKHYSVPVIVLVPMFKLSPVFLCNFEQEAFNLVGNTESVLPYNTKISRSVKAYAPVSDYVPPELITLFISSSGGYTPSYVYRLLTEMYHPDDYDLK